MTRPQEDKPFESHAVAVTFFEDRAEVVRKATVAVGPDPEWVSVSGVSPYLDDRSLQAKTAEPVRVLAARVHRRVTQQGEVGREEITALETAERLARERLREAGRRIERSQTQRERLTVMLSDWSRSLARVPVDTRAGKSEDWKASYQELEARLREAMTHEALAQAAEQDARDALTSASARLAQARVTRPICEAFVLVQLAAPKSGPVELAITYRTPCALWRPEHTARLLLDNDDAKSGQIEITSWATVWQNTGEDWGAIEATFSTARPARSASPPSLNEDLIALRRKSEDEKRVIRVEARDQAIAKTDVGEGVREVDEMPGVDDGGLPLSFAAAGSVSLPSHGRPFRVEIGRITLPASLARILVPELAQVAHYQASATLASKTPLLAGPIGLLRGSSMVGRARMAYVAPGEPFVLGFGQDDNLRLRRTEETKQEQTAIVGTQKIEHTVHIYLSNLSDTGRGVTLVERIPVSEIAEVQVDLLEAKGWRHDAKDGFLSAEITVGPRETREMALTYELRAKSNVQL